MDSISSIKLDYNPAEGNFYDPSKVRWVFLILLTSIELLQMMWFK